MQAMQLRIPESMRVGHATLQLHARGEEEIFYPAALLVGELVRARSQ